MSSSTGYRHSDVEGDDVPLSRHPLIRSVVHNPDIDASLFGDPIINVIAEEIRDKYNEQAVQAESFVRKVQ